MGYIIKKVDATTTYSIRKKILRKGMDLPCKFNGDLNKDTFHIGAFLHDEIVGVATFIKSNNKLFDFNQYQLRGMATVATVRGKGIGKAILEYGLQLLKEKRVKLVWCNARKEATTFYTKLGFNITGNLFMIEKVGPHFTMFLNL